MNRADTVKFNPDKLHSATVDAELLRSEIREKTNLSSAVIAAAYAGRRLRMRSARSISQTLGVPLKKLLADAPLQPATATKAAELVTA